MIKKIAYLPMMLMAFSASVSSAVAKPLDDLTVVAPWEINSLDLSQAGAVFQRMQLVETLVDVDEKGNLIAGLASRWQANDNQDGWTFWLREGVQFHDGKPLDAQAVINSLTIALKKPGMLQKASVKSISSVEGEPNTVYLQLEKPLAQLPAFLTHYSTAILSPSAYDANQTIVALIGTGAYKPEKVEPPQALSAKKFEQFWGDKAKVETVHYLANSRSETRALLAEGHADYLVYNLDPASVTRLQNNPERTVHQAPLTRTIQLKLNVKNLFFENLVVRQALSDAIDRDVLAEKVLRLKNAAATQILPPAFASWRIQTNDSKKTPQAIKATLLQAGFSENKNGMLEKDGKPFQFTLRTFSDRPELPIIATVLQHQWKQIGVAVEVAVGNFSEIPLGHQDGTLDMALYARNYGTIPDPMGVLLQDFAAGGGDWGAMNWQNQTLIDDLDTLAKTVNTAESDALKQRISQIIYDEKPVIPLVYYQQNVVSDKQVKGVLLDPFERNFNLNRVQRGQ